jgi:hypothetical protein
VKVLFAREKVIEFESLMKDTKYHWYFACNRRYQLMLV